MPFPLLYSTCSYFMLCINWPWSTMYVSQGFTHFPYSFYTALLSWGFLFYIFTKIFVHCRGNLKKNTRISHFAKKRKFTNKHNQQHFSGPQQKHLPKPDIPWRQVDFGLIFGLIFELELKLQRRCSILYQCFTLY